jgi:hypothetical protein
MTPKDRTPDVGCVEGSGDLSSLAANDSTRDNHAQTQTQVATLTPHWRGGKAGYLYDVTYAGELIVTGSHDPEHDMARALFARGVTGLVEIVDGNTGKPRTFVNVVPAAKWSVFDGQRGLRRDRWKPFEHPAVASHSPEDGEG